MTKRLIIDVLMSSLFLAIVLAAALMATNAENKRIKRECIALFQTASRARDSLTVLINVPSCRTYLQEK